MSADIPGADAYRSRTSAFLVGLLPQDALQLPWATVIDLLRSRHGEAIDVALGEAATDLSTPLTDLAPEVRSPVAGRAAASWLRRTNMVGINVRTVGDYGGVIKYSLTLPASIDAVHLLPIWEPGVVESLYGIAGWNLNTRFFSTEMHRHHPHLDSVERQLRAVSNVLHVMGKTIGMDVIPHTDRFAEPALANPDLYEWMRVADRSIIDHSDDVVREVERQIVAWLSERGPAAGDLPDDLDDLWGLDEAARLLLLFGPPDDLLARIDRRVDLVKHLKWFGLEPVPATMGVPFRGIEVDPNPEHDVVDGYGMVWHDYVITRPRLMSRVFSPLARFKLYERHDDNQHWQVDFSRPRRHVWDYVCNHYAATRHIGNFDFMRGDMSHVQMRPDGVPEVVDEHYDILRAVKEHIQQAHDAPWFGYFAESFLPARDVFQFGEELDHLEASLADTTLGDLQSTVVGSAEFLRRFRRYLDDLATRATAPAFTVMTADKDDPRFDEFYRSGNEARAFTALFLPDMPSYTGLGFEIRDVHWEPVENERYTKLFVFRERGDSNVYPSKARFGDQFVWGENRELFRRMTLLRAAADDLLPGMRESTTAWLLPPDSTGLRGTAAWTHEGPSEMPRHVFVVNYDLDADSGYFGIPGLDAGDTLVEVFSTLGPAPAVDRTVTSNGHFHRLENLAPGEARIYRIE